MKNIFLAIAFCTATCSTVYAQLMQNGNFAINQGNFSLSNMCPNLPAPPGQNWGGTTFIDGSVPNWFVTHGTPNFCWNCPSTNYIHMEAFRDIGEGIVGGYPFKANKTYRLYIGVHSILNPSKIRMVGIQGNRPSTPLCGLICNNSGGSHGISPVPFPASNTTMQEITVPTLQVGNNTFTFQANKDLDWIMIFPFDNTASCPWTDIVLTHVFINIECEDLYLPNFIGNSSPNKIFVGYRNIYAGSTYGNLYGFPLIINGNTEFEAKDKVEIADQTRAEPPIGTYFEARINKYTCTDIPEGGYHPGKGGFAQEEAIASAATLSKEHTTPPGAAKTLQLFPNPATSKLQVSNIGVIGKPSRIELRDVNSKIIMSISLVNANDTYQVDVATLEAGVYFISVIGDTDIATGKFIKF